MDDSRLERIESKLDTLSEAMVSIARQEEKMIGLFKRMDSYDENQKEISNRINNLEKHVSVNGQIVRFAERIFWICVAASVTWYMKG